MRRSERTEREPGLGILAARLLFAVQDELYTRLDERGYGDLRRIHGVVLAYLDDEGSRATELAWRSGRPKQIVVRTIDELEQMGYVERRPDRSDRRAKLVVPTRRGREAMRLSDEIIDDIERRHADAIGKAAYAQFRSRLLAIVDSMRRPSVDGQARPPRE
jgi:DNA-binding MarR family transcriptional regulator